MEELKNAIEEITKEKIIKVVISNKINKETKYNKIVFLLKESKNKEYYQIEKYTDKQVFHENIDLDLFRSKFEENIAIGYKQVSAWSDSVTYDLRISKKGKVHLGKKMDDNDKIAKKSHNKKKNYILQEGMIIEPLIDLGVFTKDGKVINSKYDKYKQINRFVEIIDDEIKKNDYKELTILDFGCGKSYLTFVLYYYFVKIKKINVKMIGLDLKEDVIKKCNEIAKAYKYDNLHFELG
ncbi:methyltransferase, partial [Clostridium butyricum]